MACNKPPTDYTIQPPKELRIHPCAGKRQKLGSDSECPKKRRRRRKKIRNTNPAASRQPEHLATDRHLQHPGRGPVHWPVPGPCRPAAPPGQSVQCRLHWPASSVASWEEKSSKFGGQSMVGCLLAARPPPSCEPGVDLGCWGLAGWLGGWVSVRDRAWQSFGRSVGQSVGDGWREPTRKGT